MADRDPYSNNSGGQKKKKQQGQSRGPRESDGKTAIRGTCKWGRLILFFWIFLEADNWLQTGLLFIWRGMEWSTIWIGKIDTLLVWGVGMGGYIILWAVEEYLLNEKQGR